MDFLKKNSWIAIAILVIAIGAAIYSGVVSMQGPPAPPPLHGPTNTGPQQAPP